MGRICTAARPRTGSRPIKLERGLRGRVAEAARQRRSPTWIKDNPDTPEPKPEDLAEPFFTSFSKDASGHVPGIVEHEDGRRQDGEKTVEPVKEGSDIQSAFFDLWLQRAPRRRPGEGSRRHGDGLRFGPGPAHHAGKCPLGSSTTCRSPRPGPRLSSGDEAKLHERDSNRSCGKSSFAPLGGLVGVPLVNVLEINLALEDHFQKPSAEAK